MKLDQSLRDRLSRLGDSERGELGAEARDRVARAVALAAPGLIRRARLKRSMTRAGAAGMVGGALLALAWRLGPAPPVPERSESAAALPCASYPWPAQQALHFQDGADRSRLLDLGQVASLRATADSEVTLVSATPCRTELRLTRGELRVHARQLGGGALVIRTPTLQVAVRGTLFAVHSEPRGSTVEVVEGSVDVRPVRADPLRLSRGQRLSFTGPRPQVDELGVDRAAAIRASLGAPPPPAPPPPPPVPAPPLATAVSGQTATNRPRAPAGPASVDDQLQAADSLFHAGDLPAARRLFDRVGAGSGGTAEAAWLRLARLELNAGNFAAARLALAARDRRFGPGLLAAEALWLAHEIERHAGNVQIARDLASKLARDYPDSAYAERARVWLSGSVPLH